MRRRPWPPRPPALAATTNYLASNLPPHPQILDTPALLASTAVGGGIQLGAPQAGQGAAGCSC